jgi:hypothetical protein
MGQIGQMATAGNPTTASTPRFGHQRRKPLPLLVRQVSCVVGPGSAQFHASDEFELIGVDTLSRFKT